ncbi:MAG: sulfatase [Ignavibacteriales bacterium]|nr:sulfatase [Ignavibacteriales bacterium]MCB9219470.1 sulfatase [Ignavibacteriales bacterium]
MKIKLSRIVMTIIFFTLKNIFSQVGDKVSQEKPNIIFILTDDQRWDEIGYAGNKIIQTPEMDKLAKDGNYFNYAFVTTPICAASRASIMTGLYERTHKFTFETPPLRKKYIDLSYPKLLKENGYKTGFIGKFGMSFENNIDTMLFDYYKRPKEIGTSKSYFRLSKDQTKHVHLTNQIGELSTDFLEQFSNKEPFCLSVSFHAPHAEDQDPNQYIYPLELDSLYQNITFPNPLMSEDYYFLSQPKFVREGLNRIRWHWRFDKGEKYQKMIKGYYRMISGIDKVLGNIRNKLNELGIEKNTIIIFMSDNGYFLGERQFAGKWLMYDNSLRVPLIIYDPRNKEHKNIEEIALNIDIAPTILSYAGISIPTQMQGMDLRNIIAGRTKTKRTDFLCEHLYNHPMIPKSEGIRTEKYKYFRYIDHQDFEELYDLENDPNEVHNLILDEKYSDKLNELRNKCNILIEEYSN